MNVFDFLSDDDISGPCVVLDELLPLVHTTPSRCTMDILQKMRLEKKTCNKFNGERLLYFFYARPAYRKVEEDTSSDRSLVPVVLIVKPILDDIKRVYPFDSGAFDDYKKNHLNHSTKRSDYELPNTFLAIRQYIKAIFGNNLHYYIGKCRVGSELPDSIVQHRETNHDLDNLLNLISSMNRDKLDDRRKTIEIQSSNDYDLSGKLLSIIVPNFYRNDKEFLKIIKASGAEPDYYTYYHGFRINEYVYGVYDCVKKYYVKQGHIALEDNYEN